MGTAILSESEIGDPRNHLYGASSSCLFVQNGSVFYSLVSVNAILSERVSFFVCVVMVVLPPLSVLELVREPEVIRELALHLCIAFADRNVLRRYHTYYCALHSSSCLPGTLARGHLVGGVICSRR